MTDVILPLPSALVALKCQISHVKVGLPNLNDILLASWAFGPFIMHIIGGKFHFKIKGATDKCTTWSPHLGVCLEHTSEPSEHAEVCAIKLRVLV